MSVIGSNILSGASGQGGYDIDYSLRCDGGTDGSGANGSNAYLAKEAVSAGTGDSQRLFTLSCWIKLGGNSSFSTDESGAPITTIYSWADGNGSSDIGIHNTNTTTTDPDVCLKISSYDNGGGRYYKWQSNNLIRDPSAWYHLVVAIDTTQATQSNRIKAWLNNEQITSWHTMERPDHNQDIYINGAGHVMLRNWIGATWRSASSSVWKYWDGYLAELHALDGIVKIPSDFAETNPITNKWQAKKYTGLYGSTGCYLKFDNVSNFGEDSSSNGDDFDVTNFTASDQVIDTPQNSTGGNFSVINSVRPPQHASLQKTGNTEGTYSTSMRLLEGNLKYQGNNSNYYNNIVGTMGMTSGKWYWEVYNINIHAVGWIEGRCGVISIKAQNEFAKSTQGHDVKGTTYYHAVNGQIWSGNGSGTADSQAYGATFTTGDLIGIACNMDDNQITYYKNGTVQNSGTPFSFSSMTQQYGITDGCLPWFSGIYLVHSQVINFGQDSTFAGNKTAGGNSDGNNCGDFFYTVPTGYLALCTNNSPEPSIALPGEHFNTALYTGNGSTQSITGVGFQPDLVWAKSRSYASSNALFDTIRGVTNELISNDTAGNTTRAASLTAFDSGGFSLGADAAGGHVNINTNTYVAWNWKAGGTGVANTDGNMDSTVSANTTAGFSICKYEGQSNGSNTGNFGHGLSAAPELVLIKNLTQYNWIVYSKPTGNGVLVLNNDGAFTSNSDFGGQAPSASVVYLGNSGSGNQDNVDHIAYCFHSVEGYSKIGEYMGNGSINGTFIHVGFRPAMVLIKRVTATNWWCMQDSKRIGFNVKNYTLAPNSNYQEQTDPRMDFLANGFKMRQTYSTSNDADDRYLYWAIAESPFAYSNAR